jgi:erythromycin esterase-like protein
MSAVDSTVDLGHRLHDAIHPARRANDVIEPILDLIGTARVVMIGEASHGTREFYAWRAAITKKLITDRGFTAVCVEADWPDAWRVNRFVRGFDDDSSPAEALAGFKRFPQWMWRNTVVLDFVDWLRRRNDRVQGDEKKAGFYGLDLYSLNASIRAVLDFLDKVDHAAATRARYRYSCFEDFGEDPQAYGYHAAFELDRSCEDQAVAQLVELRQKAAEFLTHDRAISTDEYFYAEQNARLVKNAERYYRTMFRGDVPSWNLRDEHMVESLEQLIKYLDNHVSGGGETRAVIWAHNSHLGDARATEMSERGELNVGQLVREHWGEKSRNVGFSTYTGQVTAADNWDAPAQIKRVRPGLPGSYEALFHEVGKANFLLRMPDASELLTAELLDPPRLQRAIGVIYRPQTERISHYFHARLAAQFDAMIHLDTTGAVMPLEPVAEPAPRALEETYPFGV